MTAALPATHRGATGSHRERKRARTWTAIHLAAAGAAALHDRLADVTIEAIADQAEISPRTFFNYFKSKEDAVLGLRSPVIDDAIAAEFRLHPGDDLVEKVAFLLLAVFRTTNHRAITHSEFVALMDRHPELARKRFQHIDDVQSLVTGLVTDRLAESQILATARGDHSTAATADMIVTVAGAVMRTAMRPVLTTPVHVETDVDAILRRTCTLFREINR